MESCDSQLARRHSETTSEPEPSQPNFAEGVILSSRERDPGARFRILRDFLLRLLRDSHRLGDRHPHGAGPVLARHGHRVPDETLLEAFAVLETGAESGPYRPY